MKTPPLSLEPHDELLTLLQARFEKNANRHPGGEWADVRAKLEGRPESLRTLGKMESTGGEPDVIVFGEDSGHYAYCDCSAESPTGRRSLCFDPAALEARRENKPAGSAIAMAEEIGVELLTEEQYRELQTLGEFDLKTSSWLATPPSVRKLDGAIFADRRYGRVFVYHNGVQSYYASRGFRGLLRI